MLKKWLKVMFYLVCFFAMAAVIYRLACYTPPKPWEEGYDVYRIGSAIIAAMSSGIAIGGVAWIDWLLKKIS